MKRSTIMVVLGMLLALLAPTAALATTYGTSVPGGVVPRAFPGNFVSSSDDDQVCYDLAAVAGWDTETLFDSEIRGFKVDPPVNFENDYVKVTLSADGRELAWETKNGTTMLGVIVKGGPNYNLYDYVSANKTHLTSDGKLVSPLHKRSTPQISHYNICVKPPVQAGQGCTPGFWRNDTPANRPAWATLLQLHEITRDSTFNDSGLTYQAALTARGGGLNALLRHASAAHLNALHPGVNYAYTPAQVLAMFDAARNGGDIEGTKNLFEAQNESGCPLSATNG
jgi:hypothetical protein